MSETRKTKKVAGGFNLAASAFALVLDENDSSTWKLPLYVPGNIGLTVNLIKNAVERFAHCQIPDAERASVWKLIAGAAKAHGIPAGVQPVSGAPGATHPETAQLLDVEDNELKAALAVGELAAEQFLRRIGY